MFVDQFGPYVLPNGSFAAFVGEGAHWAIAHSAAGPWQIVGQHPSLLKTGKSPYGENPVVTRLRSGMYIAVFDAVFNEHAGFGMGISADGVHWSEGQDIVLPQGCRTPLGLIEEEEEGLMSLLFTRRFDDCANQTQKDNGATAVSPVMCANVYYARFQLSSVDPKVGVKSVALGRALYT